MDNKNLKNDNWETITRGANEILPAGELQKKLVGKKPLRIKVGFDPTSPDLHLGHMVLMEKMRHFQELGHQVIFLIGDWTAAIGDPTGRDSTRPSLSPEQIKDNAATYAAQAFKILCPEKTEVRYNSEWYNQMAAADLIRLASCHTVSRMLERDDFSKRHKAGTPIAIHEFLYPLAQGYDSVVLKADVELGGNDQKFNLLLGRELQKQKNLPQQAILTTPLLEGLDGVRKMSKSLGNHIGINEPAAEIYGKLMSISDNTMWRYYELLSHKNSEEIKKMHTEVSQGCNPVNFKRDLAYEITARFSSVLEAEKAAENFIKLFSQKINPAEIEEYFVPSSDDDKKPPLFYLLKESQLVKSSSDGKRLITQGSVRINDKVIKNPNYKFNENGKFTIRVGRRRFMIFNINNSNCVENALTKKKTVKDEKCR